MNILVCGAGGFIGAALVGRLLHAGHRVVAGVQHGDGPAHPALQYLVMDYRRDTEPRAWTQRLRGIDVVINAVGLFREGASARFEELHVRAPLALFTAARDCGVARIIQISALGSDAEARSAYHLSKRRADEALAALGLSHAIVQPSLVYGEAGTRARLFWRLASLPLLPVPGDGSQRVQPVRLDDLCDALARLAVNGFQGRIAAVGPAPLALAQWLGALRAGMGLPPARVFPVPLPLVRLGAR